MVQNELKGWVVAVIGGDYRMLEHMRQARLAGAVVQHYGGVPGAERGSRQARLRQRWRTRLRAHALSLVRFPESAATMPCTPNSPLKSCA